MAYDPLWDIDYDPEDLEMEEQGFDWNYERDMEDGFPEIY